MNISTMARAYSYIRFSTPEQVEGVRGLDACQRQLSQRDPASIATAVTMCRVATQVLTRQGWHRLNSPPPNPGSPVW